MHKLTWSSKWVAGSGTGSRVVAVLQKLAMLVLMVGVKYLHERLRNMALRHDWDSLPEVPSHLHNIFHTRHSLHSIHCVEDGHTQETLRFNQTAGISGEDLQLCEPARVSVRSQVSIPGVQTQWIRYGN